MPTPPPLYPLGDPNSPYAYTTVPNTNGRRRLRDNSWCFNSHTPQRTDPDTILFQHANPTHAPNIQHVPVHPRGRIPDLENTTPPTAYLAIQAPPQYFDDAIYHLPAALSHCDSIFRETGASFLHDLDSLHSASPAMRNNMWARRLQIGTLEHAPFNHNNDAFPQHLVQQISAFDRAHEQLGRELFKVLDTVEKVSPAREHVAQARTGMKREREDAVGELKREVWRCVELLGETKEDYECFEEMQRNLGVLRNVVWQWTDFVGEVGA